jgi:hypothetical protein
MAGRPSDKGDEKKGGAAKKLSLSELEKRDGGSNTMLSGLFLRFALSRLLLLVLLSPLYLGPKFL